VALPPSVGQRRRILFLLLLAVVAAAVLAGRLAWLQLVRGEALREKALNVRLRDIPVQAKRGTIYDRAGRELAISARVDSVYAIPGEVRDVEGTSEKLAGLLNVDAAEIAARLREPVAFVWVKRRVEDAEATAIKNEQIAGVGLTQESRRFYPKGSLACHLLGFAGIDSQGLEGVEVSFDRELRGVPGRIVVEYDAYGRELPQAVHRYVAPQDGADLILTIDEVIQFVAERELDRAMQSSQAARGVVIVLDPRTGEILAMASRPGFDPNDYASSPAATWRNTAISDTFCPGSTFKPITAAAALEEGAVTWGSWFYCPGSIKVPGASISCVGGHGSASMSDIIVRSCNVGFVQVGLRLGAPDFYRYARSFGLLDPSGVDLPGEGVGLFPAQAAVKPVDLAVMAFGQTLTITPYQLTRALAAIVNDGALMRPLIARELRRPGADEPFEVFSPQVARQVISRDTAAGLREALVKAVQEGTGRRARLDGYLVGGKTGTAQKVVEGRVASGHYDSYFFGFAPADEPRLAVLACLDDPQGSYYGGAVAAPVVAAVLYDVLRYLEVPPRPDIKAGPTGYSGEGWEDVVPPPGSDVLVPSIINLGPEAAAAVLHVAGLSGSWDGTGEVIGAQTPPPGAHVRSGSTVRGTLAASGSGAARSSQLVTVPDVTGMTMREAAEILGLLGLNMVQEGSGRAVGQTPAPGAQVTSGATIRVIFAGG